MQPGGCLTMENRIEKQIELKAPVSRVWQALTDYREFGEWFRVKLEGPFVPGKISRGYITHPGYEHVKWEAVVQKMEPERLFSFTWHPYAIDPKVDYSKETPTLVEFRLEKIPSGTLLVLTETGFEKIPRDRRPEAFRKNDGGWKAQMKNIEKYVAQKSYQGHREACAGFCRAGRRDAAFAGRQTLRWTATLDFSADKGLEAHAAGDYEASSRNRARPSNAK